MSASGSAARPRPDRELTDIADYVLRPQRGRAALAASRLCLLDAIACALEALSHPECTKLIGPLVPGTVVPHGARIPGTAYCLDPANAAFGLGCLIRWLDLNDTFTAAQGSHPSDNLAGILTLADHLSRQRVAARRAPLTMRAVLEALIQAYEIQGCLAIENDLKAAGIDHPLLTRVAGAAVLARMLGAGRDEIVNAVSNAWTDVSLPVFRHAPNAGWRKSWSAADASFNAMRLAYMAVRGEMGYPSVLTAKQYGLYDARFGGRRFRFQRRYGDYVIRHSMFKFVPAGMHGQSAIECALRLHPQVANRIDRIERIVIDSQRALIGIMDKAGPLDNPADRDHCVQYIVAVGLIFGKLEANDFEDDFAADPRIDRLRARMVVREEPRFSRGFYDPARRSSANAVQVFFRDGSKTPRVVVEYPMGHPRRRREMLPRLRERFAASLGRCYAPARRDRILALTDEQAALERTPVNEFVDLLVP